MNDALKRTMQNIHAPHAMDVGWGWGNCQTEVCLLLQEALAAERRATVDEIRAGLRETAIIWTDGVDVVLDEAAETT